MILLLPRCYLSILLCLCCLGDTRICWAQVTLKDTIVHIDSSTLTHSLSFENSRIAKITRRISHFHITSLDDNSKYLLPFTDSTSLTRLTLFGNSEFTNFADLKSLNYNAEVNYFGCVFEKGANLSNSNFRDRIQFLGVKFYGPSNFSGTKFKEKAPFVECHFQESTNFSICVFHSTVQFLNSTIIGPISFSECTFNKNAAFDNLIFDSFASFQGIHLSDSTVVDFVGSVLPDTLDLSNIGKIPNSIDLLQANYKSPIRYDSINDRYFEGKRHYINLFKSDISKLRLDYFHFRLLLTDNMGKELPVDDAKTIYEALLKNFSDHGQGESYELLDIEYNDYKIKHSDLSILRPFWFLPHYWNAYGYNKAKVFWWAFVLLFAFTLITCQKFNHLNNSQNGVYVIQKIPEDLKIDSISSFFRRLYYSFIYTSIIFFVFSLKIEKVNWKKKRGVLYIFFVYVAGVICLGYIANFVLQK